MTKQHPKTKTLTSGIHSDTIINLHGPPPSITLIDYVTPAGERPVRRWLDALDISTNVRVLSRLKRVADGNLGDVKSVGQGVLELRLHFGSGYRIYIAQHGFKIIILLCGGNKSTQEQDIKNAKTYWQDYKKRKKSSAWSPT